MQNRLARKDDYARGFAAGVTDKRAGFNMLPLIEGTATEWGRGYREGFNATPAPQREERDNALRS